MASIPMSLSDAIDTSETLQPLSPHPPKRFRVGRSTSRCRFPNRPPPGIQRRPDSVFSRRGTDTPVQAVPPFAMRLPPTPTLPTPAVTQRTSSKRWKMGRSQQKKQKGCILRAVPQAAQESPLPSPGLHPPVSPVHHRAASDPLNHAYVDATMATSPNEEILSIIGQYAPSSPLHNTNPKQGFPGFSPTSPKRSKKDRGSEGDARCIGFWKDGRAHWEAEVASMPPVPHPRDSFIAELDSRPIQLETPVREMPPGQKDKRPRIQVIIPSEQLKRAPHARPPFVSQAVQHSSAGEIISSRDVSPPLASSTISVRNSAVSPLAHQIITQRQQTVPIYLDQVVEMPTSTTMSKHPSISSSSNGSNLENDDTISSNYNESNRTSWTSVDDNLEPCLRPNPNLLSYDGRTASKAFSIISPTAAGIFEEWSPIATTSQPASPVSEASLHQLNKPPNKDKPLPPEPEIPTIQQTIARLRTHASSPALSSEGSAVPRKSSRRNPRLSLPARTRTLATDNGSVPRSDPPSPTLSEAETALEEHLEHLEQLEHLSSIAEQAPFKFDGASGVHGGGNLLVPPGPAPTPPRKSSRRKRVASLPVQSVPNHIATQQRKSTSKKYQKQKKQVPQRTPSQRVIEPNAAENVIFSIFKRLHSLDDLFSLACVNRGFYRVFKRHELPLMRIVLRNASPPAWEHREVSPPYPDGAGLPSPDSASPEPEYTPSSFYRHHMRDTYIIAALKSLVLTRCQSFLRPETVMALASHGAARAARVDNAFWRIWTFCRIFGCGKSREDDIVGQMDWLRGGPLVHQTGIRSTIMTTDSFDASNALLNAPDHFAKGNGEKGLSAEELYDMTEIWTCMGVLISGFEGRTEQAREFGVFEVTDVRGGDIDGEENMLQEWIYYLTTLGLSVVLDLATTSISTDPSAFILALEKGWMNWPPPEHGGSRRLFLKEAVARVYEEKIAAMAATTPQADRIAMRQVMRQRIAAHKAEMRVRRRTGDCHLIRMSMERPMSEWENVMERLGGSENLVAPQPQRHPSTSSIMAGAPTPCPPAPAPLARAQSQLIAMPRVPELPAASSARHPGPEVLPIVEEHQMKERDFAAGASNQQNALLMSLAQAKQYDYGSPTETHPALRSFFDSASSSRRSSDSSAVSAAAPVANETVHPAFRNSVSTTASPRKQHSSNSSVSSIGAGNLCAATVLAGSGSSFVSAATATTSTTPPSSSHGTTHPSINCSPSFNNTSSNIPPVNPPSYLQAQQLQQQQQSRPNHRYSHSHPPAHPAYPFSTHPAANQFSIPPPPPRCASSGPPETSPTAFLPDHRRRVVSQQHPIQAEMMTMRPTAGSASNTADKAIFRIVEMGFTADEAKVALMRTDPGDGLRVDRAVEWLLTR